MHRSRTRTSIRLAATGIATAMLATVVIADSLVPGPDMSWHTVDGGGGYSHAELIELSIEFTGTIGQTEALNIGPLTGSGYVFTPGYWNDHAAGVTLCPADLNGDGMVNVTDMLAVITAWGGSGVGDINHSGVVDVSDLLLVITSWGLCPT